MPPRVMLINMDRCLNYLTNEGKHIESGNEDKFAGNLVMSSINAMLFKKQSRRDDLISLTYLLIYMIQGFLPFVTKLTMPIK